jgi:small subunit ribosomal protein S8
MTDPIADMLTRIRNASSALLPEVRIPHSKVKESIAHILKDQGYIKDYKVTGGNIRTIEVELKYSGRQGVISGLKRISRPGIRTYVKHDEIPRVLGGLGIAIVSTSKGVLEGSKARRLKAGGEVLCYIW